MKILSSTTFTWYQVGALKWAVLFIGIAIGSTWSELFAAHAIKLLAAGLVLSLYVGGVWLKQH
jgi:hypothetical protein